MTALYKEAGDGWFPHYILNDRKLVKIIFHSLQVDQASFKFAKEIL
jgi:hypothetical protein